MSRTIDTPSSGAVSLPHGLADLQGKTVCPFCGLVAVKEGACARCTMENNPGTRQATKARIGPWYVLQSRNPSAPGMKFSTLLTLVKRGQVTARSVVRGPTTSQLWRFAAKVKGLSREFGLCYGCGGEIDRSANLCGHCQRLQEPPIDPDVFLEAKPPQSLRATIHREVRGENDNQVSPEAGEIALPATTKPARNEKIEPVQMPEIEASADSFSALAVTEQEAEPARAKKPTGQEILSAKELAAAFSLNFNPNAASMANQKSAGAKTPRKKESSGVGTALLVLTLMAIGGASVWLYFDDAMRNTAFAWVDKTIERFRGNAAEDQPKKDEASEVPPSSQSKINSEGSPKADEPAKPKAVEPRRETPPPVAPKPSPKPDPVPQAAPEVKTPPPVATVPTPAPNPPKADSTPSSMSDEEAIQKARDLWIKAMDCEQNDDYAGAVKYYEQIMQLPSSAWYSGVERRLENARRHAAGQK